MLFLHLRVSPSHGHFNIHMQQEWTPLFLLGVIKMAFLTALPSLLSDADVTWQRGGGGGGVNRRLRAWRRAARQPLTCPASRQRQRASRLFTRVICILNDSGKRRLTLPRSLLFSLSARAGRGEASEGKTPGTCAKQSASATLYRAASDIVHGVRRANSLSRRHLSSSAAQCLLYLLCAVAVHHSLHLSPRISPSLTAIHIQSCTAWRAMRGAGRERVVGCMGWAHNTCSRYLPVQRIRTVYRAAFFLNALRARYYNASHLSASCCPCSKLYGERCVRRCCATGGPRCAVGV